MATGTFNSSSMATGRSAGLEVNYNDDPLYLQSSDNTNMQLVGIKLDGTNFQKWSRSVKNALKIKMKLGFIDGSFPQTAVSPQLQNQWMRCDAIVVSWIQNSMIDDLAGAFVFVNSAKQLWDELTERFGQSNGPLLFQLEKQITELYQGDDLLAVYYTKLKQYWDELSDLSEVPVCTCANSCSAVKKIMELGERQKLMQFLMHLNEDYDAIRGQILLLDPLPSVNKAYCMIQRVEKQRQVTGSLVTSREVAAHVMRAEGGGSGGRDGYSAALAARNVQQGKRDFKKIKNNLFCEHCQRSGHTRDRCFQLIGYPDWYEGNKAGGKSYKPHRSSANMVNHEPDDGQDTPLDNITNYQCNAAASNMDINQEMLKLAQEMMKLVKGKKIEQSSADMQTYAHFAGPFN